MINRMYIARKILISLILILLLSNTIWAQKNPPGKTTATENLQKGPEILSNDIVSQKDQINQETDKAKKKKKKDEESSEIKKVKGSNIDMSKARGARPPYITRPSGSSMPKGAGKPGGATRAGRR
jgi:hypothetical protein